MIQPLKTLNDTHLIDSTEKVVTTLRRVDLALLEHLAEIEARELHLKSGYSSLFKMCTEKFRLSEASAYRRVAASRLLRKYPLVKAHLAAGDVSMCTLAAVAGRIGELTSEVQRLELLTAIAGKSKSQVDELLARSSACGTTKKRDVIRPVRAAQYQLPLSSASTGIPNQNPSKGLSPALQLGGGTAEVSFRIAFTASSAFRDKFQKARDLLKHKKPNGSIEAVLEEALDCLLKSRDLDQKKPRKAAVSVTSPRYIPTTVKRHVIARDSGQCTFTSTDGRRCDQKAGLEFEHRVPFAHGGSSADYQNIELLCRSHNAWRARQIFSKSRQLSGPGKVR